MPSLKMAMIGRRKKNLRGMSLRKGCEGGLKSMMVKGYPKDIGHDPAADGRCTPLRKNELL
jgi:hypothetical protein